MDNSLNKQIDNSNGKREERFEIGDRVLCRDYGNPNRKRWVECTIDEVLGNRLYLMMSKVNLPETNVNSTLAHENIPKVEVPMVSNCFRDKLSLSEDAVTSENVSLP